MARTRRPMTTKQIAAWTDQYAGVRPTYEAFVDRLAQLAADLLEREGVDVAQIERRAKAVASFRNKLSRKGRKYADPLVQITDLAGLRVVVYTLADVERVAEIVRR